MAPEEIVEHIITQNRNTLYARGDYDHLTHEQVLHLMNVASMQGFRFGSESALAAVQSQLVMKCMSVAAPNKA